MWHSRPPRDPPPFMANAILNFHFDYLTPSLMHNLLTPVYSLCTMYMHHLLTPSHLHRLQAIIFPQDWHFQYPTAEIDKEDPPAWENDQVLIFLLKNCENEGSLKPRPVPVRFIMPRHRPPTQPNLSESRSTNGITDCLSRKQQFPTKFRRNLEISRIWEMTSKPKKDQKSRAKLIEQRMCFGEQLFLVKLHTEIKEGWHNAGASLDYLDG